MNIKSLLLGSAAALVAVSGARAADAIVIAEPEPMEYVRVCDVYGTGYFYIPGTETCLRVGGYVRYDIGVGDGPYGGRTDVLDRSDGGLNDTYRKNARFSFRTWTGSETELGTLRTYTETRFNYGNNFAGNNNGSSFSLNFAWIELGGFRVGKDESAFTTFSGYAGGVIADDVVAFGAYDTNLISYTFDAGNGFSAIVSLEAGDDVYEIDSYVPHVVGGVKFTQGWGAATLVAGYDSVTEEWAAKARVDFNVNSQFSVFAMGLYGSDDDFDQSYYKQFDGNWAVWAGASYQVNEKAAFNAQVGYTEEELLSVAANVSYELVPGFKITPEVVYTNYGDTVAAGEDKDGWAGILRFQRSF
ncbi:porin [Mesorhizobium sp. SB112]|uniref:porin n=1 Tax=Mesorhizobium sp. SB112 TaxID=3151853 RepID=UPI003266D64F